MREAWFVGTALWVRASVIAAVLTALPVVVLRQTGCTLGRSCHHPATYVVMAVAILVASVLFWSQTKRFAVWDGVPLGSGARRVMAFAGRVVGVVSLINLTLVAYFLLAGGMPPAWNPAMTALQWLVLGFLGTVQLMPGRQDA